MVTSLRSAALLAIVVVTLVACAPLVRTESDAFVSATNLTDLTRVSDVVLIGVIDKASGTRNLARNPKDLSQEDRNLIVVGQDYLVSVTSVLKGSAPAHSTITVARGRGTPAQGVKDDHDWLPLATGQEYVLFLRTLSYDPSVLALAIEPSRFRIDTQTQVHAESPWAPAATYFPLQDRASFLAALTAAVTANK